MKRTVCLAVYLLLWSPAAGLAQERPAAEVYVGFPLLFRETSSQLFGVHGDITVNARQWLGVTGDVSLHVGEVFAEKSLFTGLAGPVLSANAGSRLRVFGHALFGVANSGCGEFNNGCRSDTVYSNALGGGLQVRPGNRWVFRVSAADLTTNFGGNNQHYLRLSFGVVLPIGE